MAAKLYQVKIETFGGYTGELSETDEKFLRSYAEHYAAGSDGIGDMEFICIDMIYDLDRYIKIGRVNGEFLSDGLYQFIKSTLEISGGQVIFTIKDD
jgi:hypothetical protein